MVIWTLLRYTIILDDFWMLQQKFKQIHIHQISTLYQPYIIHNTHKNKIKLKSQKNFEHEHLHPNESTEKSTLYWLYT